MAGKYIYRLNMLDKGMIYILGGVEQNNVIFHHTIQNSAQFKSMDFQPRWQSRLWPVCLVQWIERWPSD